MKTIICLILIIVSNGFAKAQELLLHTWHATLTVVDENNQPVPGAEISVIYDAPRKPDGSTVGGKITGLTDTNGIFRTSHFDGTLRLLFRVKKDGYYQTTIPHEIALLGQPIEKAKLTVATTLVLVTVGQPVPMYARKARIEIPEVNKPIGFDLMECDWVPPYGKGKHSDFIFESTRRWANWKDFDSSVTLTFQHPGDGVIATLAKYEGSELRMPGQAPSDGYQFPISFTLSHTPREGWQKDSQEGLNYYFRTRSILSADGSIKSALYGKIYGAFELDAINSKKSVWVLFQYYLNSEPNSRNVEFDPKNNLLKNIKEFDEQVRVP
jgi:hypothetical protein